MHGETTRHCHRVTRCGFSDRVILKAVGKESPAPIQFTKSANELSLEAREIIGAHSVDSDEQHQFWRSGVGDVRHCRRLLLRGRLRWLLRMCRGGNSEQHHAQRWPK